MTFFETDVHVFLYLDEDKYFKKQYSYECAPQKAIFVLNIGIVNFPKYQHAMWLKDSENVSECFVIQIQT
jgi:hypothetical protein